MTRGETGNSFSLEVDRRNVGWVTFDVPDRPVNLLTTDTLRQLDALLSNLESRIATGKLVAVVIRSGKDGSFIAGADVEEIAAIRDAADARTKSREGQRIFRRIDRLSVPTIAAVNGDCLGGGTELILACDYRTCADRSALRIGLPEVKLGILPGFGGTVRLPRLCGIRSALEIILTGDSVSPSRAKRIGLVDRLARPGRLREKTGDFADEILTGRVHRETAYRKSWLDRALEDTPPGRKLLFALARRRTRARTGGNYPAPLRALDVIEKTHSLPIDRALELEASALAELIVTPQAENLVRIFRLSRRAKKGLPAERLDRRRRVEKLGVLGAGTMGGAIAELAATRDVPSLLKDIDRDALNVGLRHARELLEKAASAGLFPRREADLKFALIEGTLSYDDFGEADLVIEAVAERMAVKRQVLRETEERVLEDAVFATNTSSLSVAELAEAAERPERVVGLHFFNPVHRMPLVEVVRTERSSEAALATAFGFALDMGKTPLVVADGPGFLVNRILAPYLNEAGHLLAEGSDVESVDEAIAEFGMPMGPCRLLDEIGFDVAHHVSRTLQEAFGERMEAAGVIEMLREDGRLGKKNGLGFYIYDDGKAKKPDPEVRRRLSAGPDRTPDAAEIRRRCLYPMVNEAAYALEDGIVGTPGEVDLAMIMGTGFPPFRGGPLRWADQEGITHIAGTLEALADSVGSRFRPASRLKSMAARGENFTDSALT